MPPQQTGSMKSTPRTLMREIFLGQKFEGLRGKEIKDSSVYTKYRQLVAIQKKEFPSQ